MTLVTEASSSSGRSASVMPGASGSSSRMSSPIASCTSASCGQKVRSRMNSVSSPTRGGRLARWRSRTAGSVTQVGFVAGMGRQPSRSPRIDALRTAPYRRDVNGSNPTQRGRHGRALATALAAALLCAACGRDGDGDAAQAGVGGRAASGSVTISGDDREAGDLTWSRPRVELDPEAADEAQEQAGAALEEGRLYDDDESAIPLFLALLDRDADDPGAKAGLERARQRLLAMGDEALADAGEDFVALREARRVAAVARAVWPGDGEVEAYLQRVDLADQLWQ